MANPDDDKQQQPSVMLEPPPRPGRVARAVPQQEANKQQAMRSMQQMGAAAYPTHTSTPDTRPLTLPSSSRAPASAETPPSPSLSAEVPATGGAMNASKAISANIATPPTVGPRTTEERPALQAEPQASIAPPPESRTSGAAYREERPAGGVSLAPPPQSAAAVPGGTPSGHNASPDGKQTMKISGKLKLEYGGTEGMVDGIIEF